MAAVQAFPVIVADSNDLAERRSRWEMRLARLRDATGKKAELLSVSEEHDSEVAFAIGVLGNLLAWSGASRTVMSPDKYMVQNRVIFVRALGKGHCFFVDSIGNLTILSTDRGKFAVQSTLKLGEGRAPSCVFVAPGGCPTKAVIAVEAEKGWQLMQFSLNYNSIKHLSTTPVDLPEKNAKIISVAQVEDSLIVLWRSGDLHIMRPGGRIFRRTLQRNAGLPSENGYVIPLHDVYFAVLCDDRLSFWDVKFGMAHLFLRMKALPRVIQTRVIDFRIEFDLEMNGDIRHIAYVASELNLATAMEAGPGKCMELGEVYDEPPLASIPSITSSLQAAADASTTERFEQFLESSELDDLEAFRQVISPSSTPTPESLLQALSLRSKSADVQNPGKTPSETQSVAPVASGLSERLASAAAARCTAEIKKGNLQFANSLTKILKSGSVSLSALASSYASLPLTDSVSTDPLAVLCSVETIHTVKAFLKFVKDVPEREIVRILAYALSLLRQSTNPPDAYSLIDSCLLAPHDLSKLTTALKLLPLRDIIQLVELLDRYIFGIFFDMEEQDVDLSATAASIRNLQKSTIISWVENSIEWLSCLLEAHFTSLVVEASARKRIRTVLKRSHEALRYCEMMEPVEGMLQHLLHRKALPETPGSSFRIEVLELP